MEAILPNLGEELAVTLLTAEETDQEDASRVDREQGSDAVEFGGEDLQDDESERELRQSRPDVGAFKGSLGCAHLDNLVRRQDRGTSAMQAQSIAVSGISLDQVSYFQANSGAIHTSNMMSWCQSLKLMLMLSSVTVQSRSR